MLNSFSLTEISLHCTSIYSYVFLCSSFLRSCFEARGGSGSSPSPCKIGLEDMWSPTTRFDWWRECLVCIRPSFCWKEQVHIPYCISKVLSFQILSHFRCVTSTTLIELPKGIRSLRCLGAWFFLKNGLRKCFITCILVIPLLLLYNWLLSCFV